MDNGSAQQAAMNQARVWSNRAGDLARAVARHDGRALRALTRMAAAADRVIKGSEMGDSWQALGDLVIAFAGAGERRAA